MIPPGKSAEMHHTDSSGPESLASGDHGGGTAGLGKKAETVDKLTSLLASSLRPGLWVTCTHTASGRVRMIVSQGQGSVRCILGMEEMYAESPSEWLFVFSQAFSRIVMRAGLGAGVFGREAFRLPRRSEGFPG